MCRTFIFDIFISSYQSYHLSSFILSLFVFSSLFCFFFDLHMLRFHSFFFFRTLTISTQLMTPPPFPTLFASPRTFFSGAEQLKTSIRNCRLKWQKTHYYYLHFCFPVFTFFFSLSSFVFILDCLYLYAYLFIFPHHHSPFVPTQLHNTPTSHHSSSRSLPLSVLPNRAFLITSHHITSHFISLTLPASWTWTSTINNQQSTIN